MTVEEAIEELKGLARSTISSKREEAFSIAISALEKEKEPQPEQADKDSSKNNSIDNDNIKLKICQEFFCKTMRALNNEYRTMSQDERRIWLFGEISIGVSYINKLLEEENK